jgi:hypothetical protein
VEKKRERFEKLRAQLANERSTFEPHWRDLGDYILPRRPRWTVQDVNKGDRRNLKIIDSTATLAARTIRSGMMGGLTSPARPWFRLTTPDPETAEIESVKFWLDDTTRRMQAAFLRSNLYNALPTVYGDMATFGTAAMMVEEDFEDVLRFYPFPIGSYFIANNERLQINVFVREFRLTVRQVIQKFGHKDERGRVNDWSNLSIHVRRMYELNQLEEWVDICHVIEPNADYDPGKLQSQYSKKFASCYYERGTGSGSGYSSGGSGYMTSEDDDRLLSQMGYDRFPVLCPRWEVVGEDAYGTDCPGMTTLGDAKALQLMHKRKAQAIEKMVNPPMVAPTSLRNQKASILPGDLTYVDAREGMQGFKPAFQIEPRINELVLDIQDHQLRVRRGFFEDLFLLTAQSDRRDVTAREIEERHEEKMVALGPTLEQTNQDLLDPLIDIAFDVMLRRGEIPEPPEELQGIKLKVEYVSIMAQAQKALGLASLERFTGYVTNIANQTKDPSVLRKVDWDQLVDEYGNASGVAPRVIRSDEDVAAMTRADEQAAQAQQTAAIAEQAATAANKLAGADMGGDNALTRLVDQGNAGSIIPPQ